MNGFGGIEDEIITIQANNNKHSSPMPYYLEDISFQISLRTGLFAPYEPMPSFAAPLLEAQISEVN
jgi:hypothetical protein